MRCLLAAKAQNKLSLIFEDLFIPFHKMSFLASQYCSSSMKNFNINLHGSVLHYNSIGYGSKHMIAFHGFGQDSTCCHPFAHSVAAHFTCYAVDLFFHGKSTRNDCEKPLRLDELKHFMDELLKTHAINRFTIAGYSLGGKFAMALLKLYPDRIDHIILIAPDGVRTNFWYKVATYPYISRRIFRHIVTHPALFFRLIGVFQKYGVLNKRVAKFAKSQMNTQEQRQRVYCSWVAFRKLAVDLEENIRLMNQYNISLALFFGKYDQVIPWKKIVPLLDNVSARKLVILDKGHNTLLCDVADYYKYNE